jgi:hypothetical protein
VKSTLTFVGRIVSSERMEFRTGDGGIFAKVIFEIVDRDQIKEIEASAFARPEQVEALLEKAEADTGCTCLVEGALKIGDKVVNKEGRRFYPMYANLDNWRVLDRRPEAARTPTGTPQKAAPGDGIQDDDVPF